MLDVADFTERVVMEKQKKKKITSSFIPRQLAFHYRKAGYCKSQKLGESLSRRLLSMNVHKLCALHEFCVPVQREEWTWVTVEMAPLA